MAAEWVVWKADLGSRAYGGPTVAGGKVFVGTNNERAAEPARHQEERRRRGRAARQGRPDVLRREDRQVPLAGGPRQAARTGKVNDWPKEGLCSTPTVEGDRVYYVSNRCTVVCADVNGFADGNQGDPGPRSTRTPTDADIIWEYDMIKDSGRVPAQHVGRLPADRRRHALHRHRQRRGREPHQHPQPATRRASSPSTRRPASCCGRATCRARTSCTASGRTRPTARSAASSR